MNDENKDLDIESSVEEKVSSEEIENDKDIVVVEEEEEVREVRGLTLWLGVALSLLCAYFLATMVFYAVEFDQVVRNDTIDFSSITTINNLENFDFEVFGTGCNGILLTLMITSLIGFLLMLGLASLVLGNEQNVYHSPDDDFLDENDEMMEEEERKIHIQRKKEKKEKEDCTNCIKSCNHCDNKKCLNAYLYSSFWIATSCTFPFCIFLMIASIYVMVPDIFDNTSPNGCKYIEATNDTQTDNLGNDTIYYVPPFVYTGYYTLVLSWTFLVLFIVVGFASTCIRRRQEIIDGIGQFEAFFFGTQSFLECLKKPCCKCTNKFSCCNNMNQDANSEDTAPLPTLSKNSLDPLTKHNLRAEKESMVYSPSVPSTSSSRYIPVKEITPV